MGNPTYSQIIDPATYNKIIEQHLYIAAADRAICEIVAPLRNMRDPDDRTDRRLIIEIGCGPARLFCKLLQYTCPLCNEVDLRGIDHDSTFVDYGNELLKKEGVFPHVSIQLADIRTYQCDKPVDVFVSQGVHHHIPKGEELQHYLASVYSLLKPGGIYVCSDEFLPFYTSEEERILRAAYWYMHIIRAALKRGQEQLAVEEAKTLLDDLNANGCGFGPKTPSQIHTILLAAQQPLHTGGQSISYNKYETQKDSKDLLASLESCTRTLKKDAEESVESAAEGASSGNLELSRGDFKVDHAHFAAEVEEAGFQIIGVQTFGPISTIGGMAVYLLRKPL